jgi:hypothetical protein
MGIIEFFNERVKHLNIFDIKLVQGAAMCVMLIVVKIFPDIMKLSVGWFALFALLLALRPVYVFFLKR